MTTLSWLELLHPDGVAAADGERPGGLVDVSWLRPGAHVRSTPRWLAHALDRLSRELAPDGVGYVEVPRPWRRRAARLAMRRGLRAGPWFMHVPSSPGARYLVPIESRTIRHAVGVLLPRRRWTRAVWRASLRAGAARLMPWLLPSVGLVVRRPGARPLLEWLLRCEAPDGRAEGIETRGTAVLAPGWRGEASSVVLHRFRGDACRPDVVAKVAPPGTLGVRREADNLARFGPDAGRAGVVVPRRLALTSLGPRAVLIQTSVPGRAAAPLLTERPTRLPALAEALCGWLRRWHAVTRSDDHTSAEPLTPLVLGRLEEVAPHVPDGDAYRRWLASRCESLASVPIPRVAAHNDLTMWNVLVAPDGGLGVVDWEHATSGALPLVDLFYALADAMMAADPRLDRRSAVQACTVPGGAPGALAERLWREAAGSLALPDGAATVALHGCWIHHAANAVTDAAAAAAARQFVDVVCWLAEHRVDLGRGPDR